jgi:hypothetical protein
VRAVSLGFTLARHDDAVHAGAGVAVHRLLGSFSSQAVAHLLRSTLLVTEPFSVRV